MRRRHFITLFGGALTWPLIANAQQPERTRRVGVLMHTAADDPDGQTRLAAFHQGLQEVGWVIGQVRRVRWLGIRRLHQWQARRSGAARKMLSLPRARKRSRLRFHPLRAYAMTEASARFPGGY